VRACVSRAAALQPVCARDRTRVNAETDVGKLALVEELKLKALKSISTLPNPTELALARTVMGSLPSLVTCLCDVGHFARFIMEGLREGVHVGFAVCAIR
jgi:hypothetical protein